MIKIYKDNSANAIFIEDANGVQFLNSLHATVDDNLVSITDIARDVEIVSNTSHSSFVDQNDESYGGDAVAVCDELNALFSATGSTGNAPTITSGASISLVEGETLNYELTADYGVGYEWSGLPSGVTTTNGNVRRIIGGSSLAVGTYNITAKAINYFGEDSQSITLTVSSPPFANTKSVEFENQDWMGANAALLDGVLGRASNGAGAGDAWTVHLWFKGGSNSSGGQTIFYFGDNDVANGGHLQLRFLGNSDTLRLQYGSQYNYLRWSGANNLLPSGTWKHVMICYNGGTTGSSSGSINDYYGRFTIYVDGVDVTSGGSWSNGNYGWSGGIDADNLRVGRYASGNYMRGCLVDEVAVWGSDQSANVASIYNSGTPHDLSAIGTPPDHWWRMGDGDTFSTIQDNVGTAHFVMYNMTAADIVSDVP